MCVAAGGVLAMIPVFIWGFPVGADFDNHFRFVLPFYEEIGRGNFFPGWLAESNFGFGDPRFRFYPPVLYYLLCFFRYLCGDWYWASISVFTLFSVTGALGVYFWTRRTISNRAAVIAAFVFCFAPYHLAQFYQASLLAEFAATALLPFAFLFVEKLAGEKPGATFKLLFNIGALAAVYSLIVTTHIPSTVIASLTLGVFALFSTDWRSNKKGLIFCAAAILLGLISSCWFWLKMFFELAWIQAGEKVSSPYYDYRNNFVFSPFAPSNLNTFYGSLVAAVTLGLFLPAVFVWRKIFGKQETGGISEKNPAIDARIYQRRLVIILIIASLSFLMTTDLSRPVWAIVPKLKDIQFPYRWFAVTSVAVSPLIALALVYWREKMKPKSFRAVYLPVILIFAVALVYNVQDLIVESGYISRAELVKRIEDVRGGRSFNDWLPRGAKELKDVEPLEGQVSAAGRGAAMIEFQTHRRVFTVESGAASSNARLRSYYYPLWQAYIIKDGNKTPTATAPAEDGTLLVAVPAEQATIEVVFTEPARTRFLLIAAALGWIMTFAFLLLGFIKSKTIKPD